MSKNCRLLSSYLDTPFNMVKGIHLHLYEMVSAIELQHLMQYIYSKSWF